MEYLAPVHLPQTKKKKKFAKRPQSSIFLLCYFFVKFISDFALLEHFLLKKICYNFVKYLNFFIKFVCVRLVPGGGGGGADGKLQKS